jgi:hypothetical protein
MGRVGRKLFRRLFDDKGAAQNKSQQTERHSHSSHQAAKPLRKKSFLSKQEVARLRNLRNLWMASKVL